MAYTVSSHLCPQNHPCPIVNICPAGAIIQDGYGLPVVDESKCIDCGNCRKFCPMGAVQKVE